MRALIFANDALSLVQDYPEPALQPGEALVRVTMAGICNTDFDYAQQPGVLKVLLRV